jgi:hypothetical protein
MKTVTSMQSTVRVYVGQTMRSVNITGPTTASEVLSRLGISGAVLLDSRGQRVGHDAHVRTDLVYETFRIRVEVHVEVENTKQFLSFAIEPGQDCRSLHTRLVDEHQLVGMLLNPHTLEIVEEDNLLQPGTIYILRPYGAQSNGGPTVARHIAQTSFSRALQTLLSRQLDENH